MIRVVSAALALWAGSVAAQDILFSEKAVLSCLATADDGSAMRGCVGVSADACMEQSEYGYSTVGMGACLDGELTFWDALLNQEYSELLKKARASDAEMADLGSGAASVEEALREMQRAWIVYRDEACDFERSLWGGGTGGGPATLSCHLRLTAEQAIYLGDAWLGN